MSEDKTEKGRLVFRASHSYRGYFAEDHEDRKAREVKLDEIERTYQKARDLFSELGLHLKVENCHFKFPRGDFVDQRRRVDNYLLGQVYAIVEEYSTTNYKSKQYSAGGHLGLISLDQESLEIVVDKIKERTGLEMEIIDPAHISVLNNGVPTKHITISREENTPIQ